jgi:dolichyl-phosphate beta-glucosyltransferase
MLSGRRVSVVVPCFNEAARLSPAAFLGFVARVDEVCFVLVDDGSTDGTRALLQALCATEPERFALVVHEHNEGQGEAVRSGINFALARGDAYVGYWDADLAAPLEEIPRFVAALDARPSCLCVVGCRVPSPGARIARHPLRALLGRVFASVATRALGIGVRDTQCGAKLFRSCHHVERLFAGRFVSRWIFDVELLARLGRAGALHELPLRAWRDVAGSKLSVFDFARAPLELWRIAQRHRLG